MDKDSVDSLWKEMMETKRESEPKRDPSSKILEESVDPGWESIVTKSSEDRIEVPVEPPEKVSCHGEEFISTRTLVANLSNRIKKSMVEIRTLTECSQGKFKDIAFGQGFYRTITDHIDNSETDFDCFLEYLRIKVSVQQTNITHVILEDVLKRHKKKLADKEIKVFKKLEKDLPDAGVRIEELRFVLNWILEYAIRSAVPNQSIGFVTRSLEAQGQNETKPSQQKGTKYIQIATILRDYEKPSRQIAVPPKARTAQKEAEPSCILLLVKKIVQKNRGSLKVSADSEGRLGISLILPIERRRVWLEFGSKENKL